MRVINLKKVKEKIFYEKLENGLDVYIVKKENFKTNSVRFFTNFGGLDLEFIPNKEKEMVKMPSGIAHFLEHKLFETNSRVKVDEFFQKNGSYINAFTNYKKTCYHFKCNKNFKEQLIYFLDFIQTPFFTDKNVKKEKGIIKQEALMTLDDPDRKFYQKMFENVFNNLNYDKTVVGSLEDIESITKEDLYKCYNTFYHPKNMCLLIVTNQDEKEIFDIIKDNQSKKDYSKKYKLIKKEYVENDEVSKPYEIIYENVKENRVCYSIKIDSSIFNMDREKLDFYLDFILFSNLSNYSKFNLDLKKKKIINKNITYSVSFNKTSHKEYIMISILSVSDNIDKYIKLLEKKLNNLTFSKEDFILIKKSIISDSLYMFNSVDGIMNYLYNDYMFNKKISSKSFDKAFELSYEETIKVLNKISNKNKSILIMKPKKDK